MTRDFKALPGETSALNLRRGDESGTGNILEWIHKARREEDNHGSRVSCSKVKEFWEEEVTDCRTDLLSL